MTPEAIAPVVPTQRYSICRMRMVKGADGEAERDDDFLEGRYATLADALKVVAEMRHGFYFVDGPRSDGFPPFGGSPENAKVKLLEMTEIPALTV